MFTGIIEAMGKVTNIVNGPDSAQLTIESTSFFSDIKLGDSIAVNGCCLTAVTNTADQFTVDVMKQTLALTNIGSLEIGSVVNLEKAMKVSDRLGGHIVQGHVDTVGTCVDIIEMDGSTEFVFEYDYDDVTVSKGSITINGVSLTVVQSEDKLFSVHIIPYTIEHTNFHTLKKGSKVNLEFDIIGKYVRKMMNR